MTLTRIFTRIFALLLLAGPGFAAEISSTGVGRTDPGVGCSLTLSGQITAGDADALARAISQLQQTPGANDSLGVDNQIVLCLSSPGGSLVEGVALAEVIQQFDATTRVGPDDACLSACAIAFMGGRLNTYSGAGWHPSRYLHPTSTLGFHAPDLTIAEGDFTRADVMKAYRVAISALALVANKAETLTMPQHLLTNMMNHVGDDFHYVDSIDLLALYGIQLYGYEVPTRRRTVEPTLCANLFEWTLDRPTESPDLQQFQRYVDSFRFNQGSGNWEFEPFDGTMLCRVALNFELGGGPVDKVDMSEWSDFTNAFANRVLSPWARYPGLTPLRDVRLGNRRDF